MATKNNSVETVETMEVQVTEVAAEVAAPVEIKDDLFTRIGKSIDGKITKVKAFGERNGKKIAKGAGVAAGAVVAVVGTALVADTMQKAKMLTEDSEPIDIEPIDGDAYDAAVAKAFEEITEAEAEESAA